MSHPNGGKFVLFLCARGSGHGTAGGSSVTAAYIPGNGKGGSSK